MEWRVCPRFPEYEVSEYGQLRRCTPAKGGVVGRVLKGWVREDGYLMYIVRKDGRSWYPRAHQLVAEAFIGPKPFPKAEVRHKDGLRILDHWSNLEWGTSADNKADMMRHGTRLQGEKHPMVKLTDAQVAEVRAAVAAGEVQRVVAERMGIVQAQVSRIVNRRQRA